MQTLAYAKLNLTLDVLGKRPDGYHDLRSVMQSVSLSDQVTIEPLEEDRLQVRSSMHFLPQGERNLAGKAAVAFWNALGRKRPGYAISLEKHIPVCAGMGGGSSDAAAVLRALNEMEGSPFTLPELAKVGEKVGSDVPYCVIGGTALVEGRGEILTPLPPIPKCYVVIYKPGFPISTPELYTQLDSVKLHRHPDTAGLRKCLESGDLPGITRRMYNVFEDVLPQRIAREISRIKDLLLQGGALGACMSGTGPTVFGVFAGEEQARQGLDLLKGEPGGAFLAHTV